MMSGVSLETCWKIKKHWNSKFYYTVASCLLFLYDVYYDARIHKHQFHFLRILMYQTSIMIILVTEVERKPNVTGGALPLSTTKQKHMQTINY
jgi:hypothetical protein